MADLVRLLDKVRIATTTTGTGAYSVGAAPVGYLDPFLAAAVSGQRYSWLCESEDGATWEVFEGIITSGSPATISRNRIVRNSSGGTTAVNWTAGTKRITCVGIADRLVTLDTDGKVPVGQVPAPLMTQLLMPSPNFVPHNTTTLLQWGETGVNTLGVAGVYGFTLGDTGIYDIDLCVSFPTSNGVGTRAISLLVGGTDRCSPVQSGALSRNDLIARFRAPLPAATFIQASVLQDSGATQTVGGNARTHFSIVRTG
jgi:hypothetical protein